MISRSDAIVTGWRMGFAAANVISQTQANFGSHFLSAMILDTTMGPLNEVPVSKIGE